MQVCPSCHSLYAPDESVCPKDGERTLHYTEVLIGLHLGPYVVRSLISEGGMGVVYVAEHPTLGRRVAIKVLRPELSLRDDIVERFTQEARAVNTIGHANIVNIYDFGKTPFGSFYIVMEFLEGRTLRALLDQGGPQPVERVREVVKGVGAALGAAHDKGFLHRDVKPENIMVGSRSGRQYVKLLDFGIAKLLSRSGAPTATGSAMGTPQYMSPEQLEDGALDHRADIYALGTVAYELLTGQVPYPGTSHAAVRQAQLTRQTPPPSSCRRDIRISRSLDSAVLRAIALGQEQRYLSVAELVDAFELGYQETIRARMSPSLLGGRRRVLVLAGAVCVAIGLGAAAAFTIRRAMNRSDPGGDQPAARPPARTSADAGDQPDAHHRLSPGEAIARARSIVAEASSSKSSERRRELASALRTVQPAALRGTIIRLLGDRDTKVRREAALTLGEMGQRDPKTVRALRRALAGQLSFVAVDTAHALALLGDSRGKKRLRALARHPGNPLLRRFALAALADSDLSEARVLADYEQTLDWRAARSKARLLELLARAGQRDARRRLVEACRTGGWLQRFHAARALARAGRGKGPAKGKSIAAAKRCFRAVSEQAPPLLRVRASSWLLLLGDGGLDRYLLQSLQSMQRQVRERGALELGRSQALGKLDSRAAQAARHALTRALGDRDEDVRLAAAVALHTFE